jgi:hypothetical protein
MSPQRPHSIQIRHVPQLRVPRPTRREDELPIGREPDGGEWSIVSELRPEVAERLEFREELFSGIHNLSEREVDLDALSGDTSFGSDYISQVHADAGCGVHRTHRDNEYRASRRLASSSASLPSV